jgi:drug/metabolite transporter (DMT)-like permease
MNKSHVSVLSLLAAIWGASFLFIRIASPVLGPAFLVELRVLLAGAALLLYAWVTKRLPIWHSQWRAYLILGALNCAIPFTLVAIAELHLTATLAALLNATIPLFTVVVAALWGQERFTYKKGFGLLLGFIGVGILVGWSPLPLNGNVILSVGASLLASFFYGVGGVYTKVAFKDTPPLALAIGQQFGAALLLLPVAALSIPKTLPSLQVILCLLALAWVSTAIAYLLYFYLIKNVGPTNTLSVAFLIPVFGLVWGTIFLGESLSIGSFVGMAIVFASIVWVTNIRFRTVGRTDAT